MEPATAVWQVATPVGGRRFNLEMPRVYLLAVVYLALAMMGPAPAAHADQLGGPAANGAGSTPLGQIPGLSGHALVAQADGYAATLDQRHAVDPGVGTRRYAAWAADRAESNGEWGEALIRRERAVVAGALTHSPSWTALARTLVRTFDRHDGDPNRLDEAVNAAVLGYQTAEIGLDRAEALFALGAALARQDQGERAVRAFEAGFERHPAGADAAPFAAEYEALTQLERVGLEVEDAGRFASACLVYERALSDRRGLVLDDYVRIQPAADVALSVRGNRLCLDGLDYGAEYSVTIRAGLPGAGYGRTAGAETVAITTSDRQAMLAFSSNAYVLPAVGGTGLPVTTVNLERVQIQVYRINDRNLIQALNNNTLESALNDYGANYIADTTGELVWTGTLDVDGARNAEVVTPFPLSDVLDAAKPGIYAVTGDAESLSRSAWQSKPTQWVLRSDLGLSTLTAADGLHVSVRSLASAEYVGGVELVLLARNNQVLARVKSDETGYARFPAPLLRGVGGNTPVALQAFDASDDFNYLDLTRPSLDLSDRGIDGRAPVEGLDAFVYTERGVYRPGETVQLVALLRDNKGIAVADQPLTLVVSRPDGLEDRRVTLEPDALGGVHVPLAFAKTARTGTWTAQVFVDPKGDPVGARDFRIEDFVPETIRLTLDSAQPVLRSADPVEIRVDGQYLYGAPAADRPVELDVIVDRLNTPFPAYRDYQFGLAQAAFQARRLSEAAGRTGGDGTTRIQLILPPLPDVSVPLRLRVDGALFEPSGRPTRRSLDLPLLVDPLYIGIKPRFEGDRVADDTPAVFELVALTAQGEAAELDALRFDLYRENWRYRWFRRNGEWDSQRTVRDELVRRGSLTLDGGTAEFRDTLDWGRYRLEVYDPATGVASSVRFTSGWGGAVAAAMAPDELALSLDASAYSPGQSARIAIEAPFSGRGEVIVANERVVARHPFRLDGRSGTVEVPVTEAWDAGTYALVTVVRPTDGGQGPRRAIDAIWLPRDRSEQTLTLALDVPARIEPRQRVTIPLTVGGQDGEAVHVTLAAVDEGILQLTSYRDPDPLGHYSGKRRLGVEMLDLYGKLIEPARGKPGRIRTGGGAGAHRGGLPATSIRTVALFQGPLPVADGQVSVPLDIPDFNGRLRVMAVAYGRRTLGAQSAPMIVRDPVVNQVALPRFLAPGDTSRVNLRLDNLDGPGGRYRLEMTATGAVAIDEPERVIDLDQGDGGSIQWSLRATEVGVAGLTLVVTDPQGERLRRMFDLSVRPAQPMATRRQSKTLAPGEAQTLSERLATGLRPETVSVSAAYSRLPSFDIVGLLEALDRFPYGCLEQTTSRALPLLYLDTLAQLADVELAGEAVRRERVRSGITRILDMQRRDGAFALWDSTGPAQPWLTAYATDFLTRARDHGFDVPSGRLAKAGTWLSDYIARTGYGADNLPALAYAHYSVARLRADNLSALRYLADNFLKRLPTRMSAAQIGAALANFGDSERANRAFAMAEVIDRGDNLGWYEYGTDLRDAAAVVALSAEAGRMASALDALPVLARRYEARRYTSTQEKLWLLLATLNVVGEGGSFDLELAGTRVTGARQPLTRRFDSADLADTMLVRNIGSVPVQQRLTVVGVPSEPLPAASRGFFVARTYYTLDGAPAGGDLAPARGGAADAPWTVEQGERLVAVIDGQADTGLAHQALVVDLLPAGFEVENTRLSGQSGTGALDWLPALTPTTHVEIRDDRYVAAFDLARGQRDFTLAYLVRAVTPGEYAHPPLLAEDMYAPEYRARTSLDRVRVTAP